MTREEAIELLKEMKYNCENHDNVYIDDKAQLKSQAIETVLSELEEKRQKKLRKKRGEKNG